ncbi:MAG: hypothetical protein REI94_07285 [Moraxellaceae bacterium]|nr:hypothetical protein [Moraxellaceae bacterium]
MSSQRRLTIHFNDGNKLSFAFPGLPENANLAAQIEGLLRDQYLMIEAEGRLLMFPFASIKYVESSPAPSRQLPNVLHGATILG